MSTMGRAGFTPHTSASLHPRRRAPARVMSGRWTRVAWAILWGALVAAYMLGPGAARAQMGALPTDSADTPLTPPSTLRATRIDPERGVEFGLAIPYTVVTSKQLDVRLVGAGKSSSGVLVNLDAVLGAFRVSYVRQLYRRSLPAGTHSQGQPVDFLGFDADQVWVFHGFRPWYPLYVGYGLGWQHREVSLYQDNVLQTIQGESLLSGGLMADYAIALPFTLQLRYFQDLGGRILQQQGLSLHLSYLVPY